MSGAELFNHPDGSFGMKHDDRFREWSTEETLKNLQALFKITNEKMFEYSFENDKLKEEIEKLKKELEEANNQIDSLSQELYED